MKIQSASKPETVRLDLTSIRKHLKKSKHTSEMTARQLAFLKKVVAPQLKAGKTILDLSDDSENAEILGLSPRQAKRVKETLSKAGIIFVPVWGRQKKKGDYPAWLINYDFAKLDWKNEAGESKRRSVSEIYNTAFQKIYETAKIEAKDHFNEQEESIRFSTGDDSFELEVSVTEFMIAVNKIITREVKALGMEREDFRI